MHPQTAAQLTRRAGAAALHGIRRGMTANLPLAVIVSAALMLPDWIMRAVTGEQRAVYTPDIVLYFLLFGACVSLAAPRRLIAGFLMALGLAESAYFCFMAYFGGVLDANLVLQGFLEYEDVIEGALGVLPYVLYAPLVVIAPYAAAWLLMRRMLHARVLVPWLWIPLVLSACTVPYKILRDGNAVRYYPVDTLPSAANSYLTWSALFFNHLPKFVLGDGTDRADSYRTVSVTRTATPGKATIVIVMNESLTYDHMSVFGYPRETTPRLEALASDPGFTYAKGISAGVGTLSTFYSFWNNVRDPRNERAFMDQNTNLFRLAKESGFRTILLSAQRANLLRGAGTQYVDELHTLESEEVLYELLHDEMFADLLGRVGLGDRNLIALHLRTAHGPYAQNYALRPEIAAFPTEGLDYRNFQINTYDNAVRYNDFIMSGLIEYFRRTIDGPLYVFLTSDHGQLLGEGEKPRYGHGMLLPQVAHVPIMLYERDGDPRIAAALRRMRDPTHYELTRLIVSLLGFEIHDPNATSGVFYIDGAGFHGLSGYIRVRKGATPSGATEFETVPAGDAADPVLAAQG